MLDICEHKDDIFLVHGGPFLTRLICRGKEPKRFHTALETIRIFLENNPNEIVTIFLENYVKDGGLLDRAFVEAQLDTYILTKKDWDVGNDWPTLDWMRSQNKRLVIFNSLGKTKLCFNEWEHVIENQWGTLHPARACKERPESKAWQHKDRSLYLLNYFPYFNLSSDNSYQRINTIGLDTFLERVLKKGLDTGSNKKQLPTFICVDYVDIGNAAKHVKSINMCKQEERLKV